MNQSIVGLFHNGWQAEYGGRQSLVGLYRRAVWLKANPRSEAYMRELFAERYPQGRFVNVDEQRDWQAHLALADTVVLLYPDAIGIGFSAIEAMVRKQKKDWATVRVLNGRRRDFVWRRAVTRQLRLRRFLERSMLGEALAIIVFAAVTPFFLVSDLVRGRR